MNAVNAYGGTGSLLHASPIPPLPLPRGRGYVALCGSVVSNVTTVPWVAGAGRCPACTAQVIRVRTLIALRGSDSIEFDL